MATGAQSTAEIYEENIRLRSIINKSKNGTYEELQSETDLRPEDCQATTDENIKLIQALLGNKNIKLRLEDVENQERVRENNKGTVRKWMKTILWFLIFVALVAVIAIVSWLGVRTQSMQSVVDGTEVRTEALVQRQLTKDVFEEALPKDIDLNVGLRQDFRLQDCNDNTLKQSFPDIDYSLLGYNILRGFPLATGHDPGFTYPIFVADYSAHAQTADCRYSVPEGLVVIPDVSCMTSFSSKTVQSTYEFSKELSVSANVHGGGWGVSFSASAGYKESSSEISSGESVFIISSAECNYYFSKLMKNKPPKFHPIFVDWAYKLNSSIEENQNSVFTEFLDQYGTHFPTEVTYGARYTYQHKMSTSSFKRESAKGVNVAVQAGYSGSVSVGGGFSLDSSQREAASNFQKNVETKTFTVGAAPPANGDAMTWASEVKSTPVPTKYELVLISDLFTEQYMGDIDVDLQSIQHTLVDMMQTYCLFLKRKGEVESCAVVSSGITFKNTRLFNHYKQLDIESENVCIDQCMEEKQCGAITFCTACQNQDKCYMFSEETTTITAAEEGKVQGENKWQSTIFIEKIKQQMRFSNTAIGGTERTIESSSEKRVYLDKCHYLCIADEHCVAYSYCKCVDKISNCFLYSKASVYGLKKDDDFVSVFISYDLETTTSPSTSTGRSTTAA